MWVLLFVPFAIGTYQPEPVAIFEPSPFYDAYSLCKTTAHKRNHTTEAMKRQTWGEFECWHATNPLLRIRM